MLTKVIKKRIQTDIFKYGHCYINGISNDEIDEFKKDLEDQGFCYIVGRFGSYNSMSIKLC